MTAPLTIIIPVLNRAQLIVRTLNSITASTVKPAELIIVDNGSEDQTLAVCRQWADAHRDAGFRIRVLESQRRGASVARNAGLSSCTTEWVYFFDSDDLFSSSLIADAFEALSHDATCDMIFVPTRQELEGHVKVRSHRRTTSPAVHILNSQFSTVSMILRTAFVRQQGGWDENLTVWDDWALAVRLLMARPHCLWLREAYHHISIHASSQTNTGFPATCQATLRAMQTVLSLTEQMTAEVGMQAQCRRALFLRARIMQGKLLQAGDANGAEAYALFARAALPQPSWREKWMADALKVYTAKGGRGAWRAALLML